MRIIKTRAFCISVCECVVGFRSTFNENVSKSLSLLTFKPFIILPYDRMIYIIYHSFNDIAL